MNMPIIMTKGDSSPRKLLDKFMSENSQSCFLTKQKDCKLIVSRILTLLK